MSQSIFYFELSRPKKNKSNDQNRLNKSTEPIRKNVEQKKNEKKILK